MFRFAQATAAMTFVLLIAGGLVTSTDSGLAVPDWPLSYGTLLPPMVGGIRYEHTHRVIAALVGGTLRGSSLVAALGPEGTISTLRTARGLFADVNSTVSIGSIIVGANLGSRNISAPAACNRSRSA